MSAVIYVCIGCNLLNQADRKDRLTCSGQCRVRAHRNGSLKALRELAHQAKIQPALISQAKALQRLRPDLAEIVSAGKLDLEDTIKDMRVAFTELVMRAAHLAAEHEAQP